MRFLRRLLAMAMILSVAATSTVFAASDIEKKSEMKKILYEKIENNEIPVDTTVFKNLKGVEYQMNVYELESTEPSEVTRNGSDDGTYTVTYGASTDGMVLMTPMTRSSATDDFWDSTASVDFFITLTYTKSSGAYKLTNVSGYADFASSGIQLTNHEVMYGCNSIYELIQQRDEYTFTGSSFNKNTGFTKYVQNVAGAVMGCSWSCILTRGSSVWLFEESFCLFNNDPAFFG